MPRYVEIEMERARQISKSTVSSERNRESGIPPEVVLEFLQQGDEHLYARILDECPDIAMFDYITTTSLTADTNAYALPSNLYLGGDIRKVEYSYNGEAKYYEPLRPITSYEVYNYRGMPMEYALTNQYLYLEPTPTSSSGSIRITYRKELDRLDMRRGKIASTTDDGTNYTTIVLEDDTTLDENQFSLYDSICVVGSGGTVIAYDVEYSSYDSTTKTLTISNSIPTATYGITSSHYVVMGDRSTTHSRLPQTCDRYRIMYAVVALSSQKQSAQEISEDPRLMRIEQSIINVIQQSMAGPFGIPIINEELT